MAGRFASPAAAADALSTLGIEFDPMTALAAADAGRQWRAFREAGGGRRDRVVADFLVGAHALHQAQALLTRALSPRPEGAGRQCVRCRRGIRQDQAAEAPAVRPADFGPHFAAPRP